MEQQQQNILLRLVRDGLESFRDRAEAIYCTKKGVIIIPLLPRSILMRLKAIMLLVYTLPMETNQLMQGYIAAIRMERNLFLLWAVLHTKRIIHLGIQSGLN